MGAPAWFTTLIAIELTGADPDATAMKTIAIKTIRNSAEMIQNKLFILFVWSEAVSRDLSTNRKLP